jgi:DpnD/PcfM-like protein
MKIFEIEVTKTLSKTVKIKANSVEDAIIKAEKLYRDEKIVVTNGWDTKIISPNDKFSIEEKQKLINDIIEYLFIDEKKHYEEYEVEDKPKEHIYLKLNQLKELNNLP